MFRGQRVLGIVPARSGSKRLPGKNLQSVAGKPLIIWTLAAAGGAEAVDRTVLSTDDQSIAETATDYGYTDVLMRARALSGDDALMTSVILHVVEAVKKEGDDFGYLALLQPTSPLRTAADIDRAFSTIERSEAVGGASICATEHPQEWMGKISQDGLLDSFFRETQLDRQSQDFQPSYQINGAIYIVPLEEFMLKKTLFLPSHMAAIVMKRQNSIDIDDLYDLQLADWLLRQREINDGTMGGDY